MRASASPDPVTEARVARGVGTVLLARAGAVVEIVAQPLYVLMFGLAGYGLYAVLWAAVNLAENVFDLGMTSALQRTVPQAASRAQELAALRTALAWGVTPCILVAALASLFAAPLAGLVNVAAADAARVAPAIAIFAWALPLWALVEITTSALRAKALFGPEIRLRILWEQIIRLALATILWVAGWGVTGLLVAHLASLAITAALGLRLVRRHYRGPAGTPTGASDPPGPGIARLTIFAGLSVLPANVAARLFGDAPTLVLNAALPGAAGASASALFVIARKLSSIVQLVRTAFVYVLAPLASAAEREDRARVAAIYGYACRLVLVVALPLAAALAAGSAPLLSLFGREAAAAATAVAILFAARAVEAVVGTATPVLQVVAGFRHQLAATVVGLALAAAAAWPLAAWAGPLTGVTAASALGFTAAAAMPMWQLYRHEALTPFTPGWGGIALRACGIAALAALAALAATALPDAAAIPAVLGIALAAVWASVRVALPLADRATLGGLARRLRLVPAD